MKSRALVAASSFCLVAACGPSRQADQAEPTADVTVSAQSTPSSSVSASAATTPSSAPATLTSFDPGERFQTCETDGPNVKRLDVNSDGHPDVLRVTEGDRILCQVTDLTFDGMPDEVRFFDDTGGVARVQRDLDGDGALDQLVVKRAGSCLEYLDRDQDGRFDLIRRLEQCP